MSISGARRGYGIITGSLMEEGEFRPLTKTVFIDENSSDIFYPAHAVVLNNDLTTSKLIGVRPTVATDNIYGVVKSTHKHQGYGYSIADNRKILEVVKSGAIVMKSGGAIASGDEVEIVVTAGDTGDKVVTATTGTVIGKAESSTTGADQDIIIRINLL